MTQLLFKALQTIIRALVGALNYEHIKLLVSDQESSALSGIEKRDLVAQEARSVGLAIGTALLNLAIEIAVNSVRAKA